MIVYILWTTPVYPLFRWITVYTADLHNFINVFFDVKIPCSTFFDRGFFYIRYTVFLSYPQSIYYPTENGMDRVFVINEFQNSALIEEVDDTLRGDNGHNGNYYADD